MAGSIFKYKGGVWEVHPKARGSMTPFLETQLKYLNELDPLFRKAKAKSELQFILCLLRPSGYSDAGWDAFENFIHTFDAFKEIVNGKLFSNVSDHYALFMYGLIMEASAPYEFLANLLNVIEGDTYRVSNFPDDTDANGKKRSQPFQNKIAQIKSRAKKQRIRITAFDDFVDNKLRNSIFHSDYAIHLNELRILHPIDNYSHERWSGLINNSFAYMEAFLGLYGTYVGSYGMPELIDAPEDFIHHRNEKVTTIVRKDHGLIGIRDNWTPEQLARGYIPFRLCSCFPYELPLIEKGQLLLPPDRVKQFNSFIKPFPRVIRKFFVKVIWKRFGL